LSALTGADVNILRTPMSAFVRESFGVGVA
jgi:hypothetical protein